MIISFILQAQESVVTGPRNSVTLLAKYLMKHENIQVQIFSTNSKSEFYYNDALITPICIDKLLCSDYVVFNQFWDLLNIKIVKVLLKNNIKYIISPRSSLMKSSMKKSPFKKVIYMLLFGFYFLRKAYKVHFLTIDEKENSILNSNSFVVSNIVDINDKITTNRECKYISYLGRFDIAHKGLDVFLNSLLLIKPYLINNGWRVRLAGSTTNSCRNDLDILKNFTFENDLSQLVSFEGPKFGVEKYKYMAESAIFIHTSRYEGQPQSVMEAMACSCSLLLTSGTNLTQTVNDSKCGIITELNAKMISQGLVKLIESDYNSKGKFAKEYYLNHFVGEHISKQFLAYLS